MAYSFQFYTHTYNMKYLRYFKILNSTNFIRCTSILKCSDDEINDCMHQKLPNQESCRRVKNIKSIGRWESPQK